MRETGLPLPHAQMHVEPRPVALTLLNQHVTLLVYQGFPASVDLRQMVPLHKLFYSRLILLLILQPFQATNECAGSPPGADLSMPPLLDDTEQEAS